MSDRTLGWLLRFIGVAGVVLILWCIHLLRPDFYMTMWFLLLHGDMDGLTAYIMSFGIAAVGVSIFMLAFVNAIGIPSILFLTVNGIIFGLIPGIVISWIGEVVGIEISFHLTRRLLRKQAQKVICKSNMLEKLDSYSSMRTIMFGRAIPYAPNVAVTAFSALSHISWRDHLIANAVGKIPAVVVEVWLGHDLLRIQEHWERLLVLIIVVCAVYVCIWRQRRKKEK